MSEEQTVYSFSRLNSFSLAEKGEGCYYSFYKTYIEDDRGINNYFGEYGTLFHETTEKLVKKELFEWDIQSELEKGIKNFNFKAPFPKMGKSYEKAIFDFFLDGSYESIFSQYEVLESEEEKLFDVDGVKIKGYPDLVATHKKYGLVIGDYKTAAKYEGDKLHHNIMQLYLYSIPIKEKYGQYPEHLIYIYPRDKGQKEYAYKFNLEDLERTKRWLKETAHKIENNSDWTPRCAELDGAKDFFASNLCNHRKSCEHKESYRETKHQVTLKK